jgi:hypothetical protein
MVIAPVGGPSWTDILTTIATAILAVFAVITALYARKAFRKQSEETAAVVRQAADGQKLIDQQAKLIDVQTGQLEVLRAQLEDQRKAAAAQAVVFELEARELQRSFTERDREAEDRRRSQAATVTAWLKLFEDTEFGNLLGAVVSNQSGQPVYDVQAYLYYMEEYRLGSEWAPTAGGASRIVKILMPHTDLPVFLPEEASPYPEEDDGTAYRPGVMFTDAYGNRWERNPRGILNPVPPDAAYPPDLTR